MLNDAVDNYDEGACWTANLNLAATQQRNDESCYDGGDDAFLWGHTRCDTKGDGERQGYNANDEARHEVGHECLLVVMLQCGKEPGLEI